MKTKRRSSARINRDAKARMRKVRANKNNIASYSHISSKSCSVEPFPDVPSFFPSSHDVLINTAVAELESLTLDMDCCVDILDSLRDLDLDIENFENAVDSRSSTHISTPVVPEVQRPIIDRNGLWLPKFDINISAGSHKKMLKFDDECRKLQWYTCTNCKRSFPNLTLSRGLCNYCKTSPQRWTNLNNMCPGMVPPELECLTDIESMIIAQVHPIISVFRHRSGQYLYKSNIISFPQNINTFVKVLPHIPSSLPLILIFNRKFDKGVIKCIARPENLKQALLWLKRNNKWYRNIEISEDNLQQYPSDGNITQMLKSIIIDSDEDDSEIIEDSHNSFVPDDTIYKQDEIIYQTLNLPYPTLDHHPVNEFHKSGYIAKAFPKLFPYGTADFSDFRPDDKITFTEYCKFLLQYYDLRFSQDFRFRYFLLNTLQRHKLLSKSNVYMRQGHWKNDDIEEFKEAIKNNPRILDGIVSFTKDLRGSTGFWKSHGIELITMCHQLGRPAIFYTLSAADYHWPDLYRLLAPDKEYSDLSDEDRRDLMHQNPVIVGYFFQYRVNLFMKEVLKPIFKVTDYWFRYEWQSRGSPHTHGCLWLEDAPNFDENNFTTDDIDKMCDYFQSMVFAVIPNVDYCDSHPSQRRFSDIPTSDLEKDLIYLLSHVQRHTKCSNHCLRRNVNTQKIACRYNFPCDLLKSPDINDNDGYLRFCPARNDGLLQRYSPILMMSWRANHDFTPICSSYAVLLYIAKYISKGEKTSNTCETILKESCKTIGKEVNLRTILSRFFIRTLTERDISAQEVCHLLMGWPLVQCSRVFISLNLSDEKWDNLQVLGSKLKIIQSSKIINYKNRPKKLMGINMDDISLFEFYKNYSVEKNKYFKVKKSRVVKILPYITHGPDIESNEPYYKQQCILHIPFRNDPNSMLTSFKNTLIQQWKDLYEFKNLSDSSKLLTEEIEIDELEELPAADGGIRQTLSELNCGIGHTVNSATIGRRLLDLGHDWSTSRISCPDFKDVLEFLKRYKSATIVPPVSEICNITFSSDQQEVLNLLQQQISSLRTNCSISGLGVGQCIVQGKAGSGKSTLINSIVQKIHSEFSSECVRVCAPTGAAALNIHGNTIHSEFSLPLDSNNTNPLQGTKDKAFQNKFKHLKFVIIDEMSMIGAKRLYQLHCRLQELNPKSAESFGGNFIYFFGDFRQLPPVKDVPLYSTTSSHPNAIKGLKIFQDIKKRIELKSSFRQAEDQRFAQLVDRLGFGCISVEDYNLLSSRSYDLLSPSELVDFEKAVYLCAVNERVKSANEKHLERLNQPIAEIIAINKPDCILKPSEEEAGGLLSCIYLSIGCRVMLIKNLWTQAGLVNGALGSVTATVYDEGVLPPDLPLYILVKLDKYYGECFFNESVPIVPESVTWSRNNVSYYRKQFPLVLNYASSIHKAQGLEIPKVIIDIGGSEFSCGLSYVAITRARKLSDIAFKPFFPMQRLSRLGSSAVMKSRIAFIKSFVSST